MGTIKFTRIGLPVFIILMLINPTSSLDTGNVKPSFNENTLSFNISIKLWGYDDVSTDLSRELYDSLPISMITESEFPSAGKVDQYVIPAAGAFFGVNNKISYNVEPINIEDEIDHIMSRITYLDNSDINGGSIGNYYENGELKNQTGYIIDSHKFGGIFENYSNPNSYTLHLLNLTNIDNIPNNTHSKHWFSSGNLQNLPEQSDIRNVGSVGSNGLFYDPSASAPVFDTNYLKSSNFTQLVSTLTSRITDLVENVFIGTPYAFNYNTLEESTHFDLIIVGYSGTDYSDVNSELRSSTTNNYLSQALSGLLPYMNVDTESFGVNLGLPSNVNINNTLNKFELQSSNDTGNFIKVTSTMAESLKRDVRDHYHDEWPIGFYYSLFVFVDSTDRQFIWDVNGLEEEYTLGHVGFSAINLAEWRNLEGKEKVSLKQKVLQGFGSMVGIPSLTNNFANQVDSVMSTYGVTDNWDQRFNQFEIDSMARRVGTLFYNSAIHSLKSLRIELREGLFRWLDRTSLDDAELILRQGDLEYERGNYTGATKLYMKGYFDWLEVKEDLVQKQNAFYNGIQLTAVVLILLYLISTLKLFTLTKKEFYDKYNSEP